LEPADLFGLGSLLVGGAASSSTDEVACANQLISIEENN